MLGVWSASGSLGQLWGLGKKLRDLHELKTRHIDAGTWFLRLRQASELQQNDVKMLWLDRHGENWTSNLWQLKESISIYQYLTLQYIFGGWLLEPKLNLAKKKCHALKWEKNREEAIGSFNKLFVDILFCSGVPQFSKNGVGFLAFAGRWDLRSVTVHHGCKHAAVQEQSGIGTERLNLQARLQIDIQVPQVVRSGTDVWEQQEEALQKMIKDYAREAGQCGCEESC